MTLLNSTTGAKAYLYFTPCGWFGAGRYEVRRGWLAGWLAAAASWRLCPSFGHPRSLDWGRAVRDESGRCCWLRCHG